MAKRLSSLDIIGTRVHITAKDIREGERITSTRCPIARAIRRRLPTSEASVGTGVVSIGGHNYTMPPRARKFVQNFDGCKTVTPFSFAIGRRTKGVDIS